MGSGERFYITGGRQRPDTHGPEWKIYEQGTIVLVDPSTRAVTPVLSYQSPPEACHREGSNLFKAASRTGDRFYVCTSTEILIYELPTFQRVGYISLPSFNDLHHVHPTSRGTLLVANTGLDMVMELTESGDVTAEYSTTGEKLWTRFSPSVDYRHVLTTKPHRAHPNYVFESDGNVWVTRGEQKDAVCLTDATRPPYAIGEFCPHDGVCFEGKVYFTRVDGKVFVFDELRQRLDAVIDLGEISPKANPLGWCRGLHVVDRDTLIVTFSRLRRTRFQEKLQWVKFALGVGETPRSEPARVAAYDLTRRRLLWEALLEPFGLHAVFSVIPA